MYVGKKVIGNWLVEVPKGVRRGQSCRAVELG